MLELSERRCRRCTLSRYSSSRRIVAARVLSPGSRCGSAPAGLPFATLVTLTFLPALLVSILKLIRRTQRPASG
jgi:hypothetical protein